MRMRMMRTRKMRKKRVQREACSKKMHRGLMRKEERTRLQVQEKYVHPRPNVQTKEQTGKENKQTTYADDAVLLTKKKRRRKRKKDEATRTRKIRMRTLRRRTRRGTKRMKTKWKNTENSTKNSPIGVEFVCSRQNALDLKIHSYFAGLYFAFVVLRIVKVDRKEPR
jgi:hypothetical protein